MTLGGLALRSLSGRTKQPSSIENVHSHLGTRRGSRPTLRTTVDRVHFFPLFAPLDALHPSPSRLSAFFMQVPATNSSLRWLWRWLAMVASYCCPLTLVPVLLNGSCDRMSPCVKRFPTRFDRVRAALDRDLSLKWFGVDDCRAFLSSLPLVLNHCPCRLLRGTAYLPTVDAGQFTLRCALLRARARRDRESRHMTRTSSAARSARTLSRSPGL